MNIQTLYPSVFSMVKRITILLQFAAFIFIYTEIGWSQDNIPFAADAACFAGEENKTSVEIFYGIPLYMIYWEGSITKYTGEVLHIVSLYDLDGILIDEVRNTKQFLFYFFEMKHIFRDIYTLTQKFELEPGKYNIEILLLDEQTGTKALLQDTLRVEQFTGGELSISDFLIAYNISMEDARKRLTRENARLYHHPAHLYLKGRPIYIYFEIYNLLAADERGMNNYTIEYAINPLKIEKVKEIPMNRLLNNTSYETPEKQELMISSEYNNFGRSDYQFFRIDHHLTEEGEYLLTIRVTDKVSETTAEKFTPIWIFEQKE
ncbi:hypothetical protein AMJ80_01010 [bacterium SM23_31]|nr:MAG: hypothetical protein AMJ80_01010 [bacterium SM23_31]